MADQLDLFGTGTTDPGHASAADPARGRSSRRSRSTGRPEVAAEVLADVHHGRYGLLDDGDRYVVFEDDTRVRLATDENVLASLTANGYVERRPARDTVSCKHGAIRRPVTPLRLTKSGHALMHRWAALAKPKVIRGDESTMTASCGHSAHAVDDRKPYGRWRVSWLAGRTVSRNQAITALVLASHVAGGVTGPAHRHWPHIVGWAVELDLTAEEAVAAVQHTSNR
ncbi:hypothetical protein [Actinophytocola sp. NPDC049390]|uniref:hypothetical protein n=1 Tax=Actinophytocola sp. NPDC049390 TaxID=3363894 RepID=UPI0037B82493